ncbi:metal dependent phosphohydrolase [Prosthecochloris aestuarii DSM 271]|uniref:Metal dependent phosphohydrolase n=1 Tax=Prosthecochloris aestuarii (strain DSM 271 / SK 413) TaxID=290512 RepID=B4S7E1_PROA2|nr:Pycsar system effector family protein [Prosthecochloris aestuarii]ACF45978.1 metal dependent phosphohydrolase [Prosthecochloris aestuarii DSM 271]
MTEHFSLLEKTASHISQLFRNNSGENCFYHNYDHTRLTVNACHDIALGMNLSPEDTETVMIACWFHDAGFLTDPDNHEEKSAALAEAFLEKEGCRKEKIETVKRCILATRMPQQPSDLLEQIVCDADLSHLSSDNCFTKSALVRIELQKTDQRRYTDTEWLEKNIDFFKTHNYFTAYALEHYTASKEKNIVRLFEQLEEKKLQEQKKTKKKKKKTEKEKSERRGVERNMEVYYRTSSRNHVSFSANVDQKANIMIQTNSLIFSIIISLLVRKLDQLPDLIIPTFILLLTCVATIITSVLATRPKVTRHETTIADINDRKANLLFFGSFVNLDLENYEWGVKEMLKDKPYYVANMIRDTYYLGKVLDQKYKYLRISYDIFMYGLIISITLYAYAFVR